MGNTTCFLNFQPAYSFEHVQCEGLDEARLLILRLRIQSIHFVQFAEWNGTDPYVYGASIQSYTCSLQLEQVQMFELHSDLKLLCFLGIRKVQVYFDLMLSGAFEEE